MVKNTISRSISDGNLNHRPLCQHHPPTPHFRTDLLNKNSSAVPRLSNYGSSETTQTSLSRKKLKSNSNSNSNSNGSYCDPNKNSNSDFYWSPNNNNNTNTNSNGSYWSPTVSEIDHPVQAVGLNRRIQLSRLIFLLIQTSLVITQTTFLNVSDTLTESFLILASYSGAVFFAAIFSPVIFTRLSEHLILLIGGISVVCFAASKLVTSEFYILLPVGVVCGFGEGLLIVKQGIFSLHFGLKNGFKNAKKNAGNFFLWTQVAVQCGRLLGSIVWSGYSKRSWNFNMPSRLCGGGACSGIFRGEGKIFPSLNNWTVGAEGKYGKQAAVIDEADDQANMFRGITAVALGLTAVVCVGFWSFCFDYSGRKRRSRRFHNVPVEEELLSVVSGDTAQIFNESPIRQWYSLLHLLIYDHKLQTLLPLVFFTGMQNAFMLTAFSKDFVACALGKKFVGWTSATYSGAFALSLWIIYKLSQNSKRIYILSWIILFQIGIGTVVIVWLPGSHDVPMFFIIAAVFGVVEGGLTALISGLLVRIFAHDWTGTYSWIVALKFTGSVTGICCNIFLCTTAQMYLLCIVLVLALIPYWLLEWKYSSFLHRRALIKQDFI